MSKIVVLVGSPRKGGNTSILVDSFVKGAELNNEVEVINVCDYKVNPCIGCDFCYSPQHECFQNDDMNILFDVIATADILVVASPVYFYGISAQLKTIVDRFHSPKRNNLKFKKMALLLVGADTIENLFDSIIIQYNSTLKYFHLIDAGKILVRGVRNKGEILGNVALQQAFEFGKNIL